MTPTSNLINQLNSRIVFLLYCGHYNIVLTQLIYQCVLNSETKTTVCYIMWLDDISAVTV